jgi:tRNA-Thr(GGU) m(6)t(6)A37 methyltransferase TsaA
MGWSTIPGAIIGGGPAERASWQVADESWGCHAEAVESTKQGWTMRPVGFVRSPYRVTADVPRGLGAKQEAEGVLEILPEYAAGLQDIDGFSHLYVLWVFHKSEGFELVSTPPCDDRPHGVFGSRAPSRPNPIGLSVVELLGREGPRLRVKGVDMLDGTPILDIKPYLSSIPEERLRRGWLAEAEERRRSSS